MGATVVGVTSVLYIELIGQEMIDIISVFSDPEETRSIQGLIEGEVKKEFNGYTNLIELIKLAESGNIRVALTQPMDVLE